MARGKKTTEEVKERLKAVIYLNPDAPKTAWARESGIPESTVHEILKDENFLDKDKFEEARAIKKQEFINQAWETVQKALKLADKRFSKALEDEEAIQEMVDIINNDKTLKGAEQQALYRRLKDLQMTNIRDIAIALGTIYDKQALASGEPTIISERQEPTPDLVKELEDKIKRLKQLTGS